LKKAKRVRLSRIDREALQRAIDLVRAEGSSDARWIDDHLRTNGFFEAGHLASYHCQYRALQLKPWEFPPIWIDDISETLKEPSDSKDRHRAAKLLQRLLAGGLSRYEPDPLAALERAEAERNRNRIQRPEKARAKARRGVKGHARADTRNR
jgi:hypothetical protein